jgi:hypothetical protein
MVNGLRAQKLQLVNSTKLKNFEKELERKEIQRRVSEYKRD